MTTDPPFPHKNCLPGAWCGQCLGNRDAGHPENYPGNGTHPRDRTGGGQAVAAIASTDCIHLGAREPGASRDLRPCTAGIAPLIHGRSLVVCCNVVGGGEWQLGKECGPACKSFATAVPAAVGIGPFKLGTPTAWVPTPPEEFPTPTSRRAVCTVVFGERGEELHGLTRASHEAYARRYGADYVILRGQTQTHPCFEKFRYQSIVEAYPDGTLCLDSSDTFVSPDCPSIWDAVPPDHMAMAPLLKPHREWSEEQVRKLCTSQGIPYSEEAAKDYYNSGVWFGRPDQAGYWAPPKHPTPGGWGDEENWCRINMATGGLKFHLLDWRWNWAWVDDPKMTRLATDPPYIWHLAGMGTPGMGVTSMPLAEVRRQMLTVLNRSTAFEFRPVFVAVLYYHDWPSQMLGSFREHFPTEPLLLVNHLPDGDLRPEYIDRYTTVIDNPAGPNAGEHGGGMDAASEFLKRLGVEYMIHVEPDCTFTGRQWYDSMRDAVANGAKMAGPCRFSYGPIHPCPTVWRVDAIPCSFGVVEKTETPDPRVYDMVALNAMLKDTHNWHPEAIRYHRTLWDTGLKAWYELELEGKAVVTSGQGIHHHWEGRNKSVPGT